MGRRQRGTDFNLYLTKIRKDDPEFYEGIMQELVKLRLSLKLKRLRQRLHKTQAELAREARTSQTAVARYEREDYVSFELTTLMRLARALHAHCVVDLIPTRARHRVGTR